MHSRISVPSTSFYGAAGFPSWSLLLARAPSGHFNPTPSAIGIGIPPSPYFNPTPSAIGIGIAAVPVTRYVPKGPFPDPTTAPERLPGFDDSEWELIDTPHDMLIGLNYSSWGSATEGARLPRGAGWCELT